MMTTSGDEILLLDDDVEHLSAMLQYLYGDTIFSRSAARRCDVHSEGSRHIAWLYFKIPCMHPSPHIIGKRVDFWLVATNAGESDLCTYGSKMKAQMTWPRSLMFAEAMLWLVQAVARSW